MTTVRFGPLLTAALASVALLAPLALVGCQQDGDEEAAPEFALTVRPPFVNRMIPGTRPLVVVEVSGGAGAEVELGATTSLDGATVTFEPARVDPTGTSVAEAWIEIPEVGGDTEFTVTISARSGATERTATVTATATPGTDDLAATATEIAQVFLDQIAATVPGLPADAADLAGGTPVAGLLVVSHYAWFTDDWEIDLSWHIMIAPDDWAELALRPRDQLTPTKAFRLTSWSTALAGGDATIDDVAPPADVTR